MMRYGHCISRFIGSKMVKYFVLFLDSVCCGVREYGIRVGK